jgi:steroid 5-alpha reductase family enzyme
VVDVLWAKGVGASALLLALLGDGASMPRIALAVLGGLWGSRLALHLWHRVRSEPEDGRYQHLRKHWNGHQGKIFGFFQFQALLIVLFALPFVAVSVNPAPQGWGWLIAAVAMWLLSVGGESLADRQLARFRADPANKGKTCRDGLWRYSRHPNYFFEWLHWFTYVLLAVQSPLWWLAWSGPLVMYVFLRWVSGIPFTEAQALRSRGDDYREYQRTTPMLFPWFPSRSSHARKESSS